MRPAHDPTSVVLPIGPVILSNRLVMAPVKTAYGGTEGRVSPRHVAYYRRRAQGGVGLIIVEPLYVARSGKEHPKQLGADDDGQIEGLRTLVQAIHDEGGRVFAHLNHAGRAAKPKAAGEMPWAPSAIPCATTGVMPRELDEGGIQEIVDAFGQAARRAREAGFDGIELQFGLGYLVAQFLSPRTNQRTDGYGAPAEGRGRFAREVFTAVLRETGEELALTVRLSADEKVEGGLTLADAVELARHAESWGADAVHVVTGSACDSPPWYFQHMSLPEGVNERLAGEIRHQVSIPVLVAGRLGDPDRIREILRDGLVDAVALGRPLVADPDLPHKMAEGRDDSILQCGACLQGCLARLKAGEVLGCSANPEVGREAQVVPPASPGQRVVVVGGGPAGMQAALTAQSRGFEVLLLEKRSRLGGLWALAPEPPGKQRIELPLRSMVRAVETAPIEVRTGIEAGPEMIRGLSPDHVIVATGAQPVIPAIPGLEGALTATDVLERGAAVGQRVLVLGGGMIGIEIAEWLVAREVEVVVVELLDDVARDMETITRKMTLKRLASRSITIHTSTALTRIEDGEAFVRPADGDAERSLGRFDAVVVAVGARPERSLADGLGEMGLPVVVVGDADEPGQVFDATQAGFAAAVGL